MGEDAEITKSSRHSKIIGGLGEQLICNWLSRSHFEVILVDHTGIDVIAYNPGTKKRMGITVKSRTRESGKESEFVTVIKKNDRKKILDACKAFACEPWIAIYVETEKFSDIYLTSLSHYDAEYCGKKKRSTDTWKMHEKDKEKYGRDSEVYHIHAEFSTLKSSFKNLRDLPGVLG